MQYKSIVLELLEQHPPIHETLRQQRKLLPTLERLAQDLKTLHDQWQAQLSSQKPHSHPAQISSEALELALHDLQNRLRCEFAVEEDERVSTEDLPPFLRHPTPTE